MDDGDEDEDGAMKLRIEKAVYGGSGLARQTEGKDAGRTVFVPFALPGELVDARLTGVKDGFAEAALVQVLEASADRVTAGCAHFGLCGGCQYQHAEYAAQIAMKTSILRETLERAGLTELPEVQVHSGAAWGYRNRVRLRVSVVDGAGLRGTLCVGYSRRGTNEFLPVRECPIAAGVLWRAAEALVQIGAEDSVAGRWVREVDEVEFFSTGDEKKLQATLFVRKERVGGFDEFCERLRVAVPELVGAGVALISGEASRRVQKVRSLQSWGADGLSYRVGEQEYWVGRGGFFQVNRFLVDELVRVVTAGRSGAMAWDLYAGVGLFSRALVRSFKEVVAVEAAGEDLVGSFKGAGRRGVSATTVEFLRGAVVQRERPELVVMDPPRAGVGAEVCDLLARVRAKEMIYVSCDPVTLARDLKRMVAAGYRMVEVHLVDLFPQTFHLETVVVLRR
jgi:23S rRNA (uracil1939-C5)-methyltransferase